MPLEKHKRMVWGMKRGKEKETILHIHWIISKKEQANQRGIDGERETKPTTFFFLIRRLHSGLWWLWWLR